MEVSSWENATTTALLAVGGYCIHRISRPIERPVKELQGQLPAASAVFREIQRHLPEPKTNWVENPERFAQEFLSRLLDSTSLRQAVWIRVGINDAFAKTEWSLGERLIDRLRFRQRAETRILDVIHASTEFWYTHVVIRTHSSSGEELRCNTDYSTGLKPLPNSEIKVGRSVRDDSLSAWLSANDNLESYRHVLKPSDIDAPHNLLLSIPLSVEGLKRLRDSDAEHYVGSDSPRSSTVTFKSEPAESLFWSATVYDFARRTPIPTPTHTAGDVMTAARAAAD